MHDHVQRMLSEAQAYLHDATVLEQSLDARSSAPSLLKILAMEILLKAAALAYSGKYSRTHKYVALWNDLPENVTSATLAVARARYPGHADLSDIERLLANYEHIFTKVRYHYELYESYSLTEQRDLGEYWVQLGAPVAESVVHFQPMELSALLAGLLHVVENAP
jgi:hypothetical protein